jgi:hypothetical protein
LFSLRFLIVSCLVTRYDVIDDIIMYNQNSNIKQYITVLLWNK